MAKIDKKYLPFLQQAKRDYVEYCEALPKGLRGLKKARNRIRYFDALEDHYKGQTINEVAATYGVNPGSLRNTLRETQNKIILYLKSS